MKDIKTLHGDTEWFVNDRFGLFIHWGLYALGARHEWLQSNEQITAEDYYNRYFKRFEPDLYDPEKWAEAAARAGMKYFVITTKHHEGFCLWDSKLTDFKAPNTPAGRDLIRPMVDAFRAKGIKVGFYHSLIDWHHEQYILDNQNHPMRNRPDIIEELNKGRNQEKYAEYLHGQVRELLTEYGKIDLLWFDFSFPCEEDRFDLSKGKGREAWNSEALFRMVHELQPGIMVNDRLDLEGVFGDMKTPEQVQPRAHIMMNGKPVVWEACQTFSGSWGYHRDENTWRDSRQLLSTLIDCVSKGGNLLLNVGPNGRGEFDNRAMKRMNEIGEWMHYNSRSIYGCSEAPEEFQVPENCKLTYNCEKRRLYIHLFDWPYKHLYLDGKAYTEQVDYAQLLHDASEILFGEAPEWQSQYTRKPGQDSKDTLVLNLPQVKPDIEIPVIELFLK